MKKLLLILPLALILCFMVGCQDKEAMAELEEFKAQAEVEEQNKEIVLSWIEEADKGDLESMLAMADEIIATNYIGYFGNSEQSGLDGFKQALKNADALYESGKYDIDDIFAKGDKVVLRGTFKATLKSDIMGVPTTGKRVEISQIGIFRIENGKIVEIRGEGDKLSTMQQLGMELKPKEEK